MPPDNVIVGLTIERSEDGMAIHITWTVLPLSETMGFITLTVIYFPDNLTNEQRRIRQMSSNHCISSPCDIPFEQGNARIIGLNTEQRYTVLVIPKNGDQEIGSAQLVIHYVDTGKKYECMH